MELSVRGKLAVSFLAITALVLALSYFSWNGIRTLGGMLDTAANVQARESNALAEIQAGFQAMEEHAKKTQLAHAIRGLEKSGGACSACHALDPAEADQAAFAAAAAKVRDAIVRIRPLLADDSGRAALDVMEKGVTGWTALYREYLSKAEGGDFAAAHDVIVDRMLPTLGEIEQALAQLAGRQRAFVEASGRQAGQTAGRSRWSVLVLIVLGGLVISGVLFVLRQTSRGISRLAVELGEQAGAVAGAAARVSGSSETLTRGAEDQAQSLEEVSASGADISATAKRNAENARNSAEVGTEVNRRLDDANCRLEELMSAMREIEESSAKVGRILRVIDEIAFQTNILALNAAVEAARAGEAGQGFAVVAGEVRNLAQRSAQAAKEIADLVEESITVTRKGAARLSGVTEAFRSLGDGARTVTRLAGDVRTGSLDQAQRVQTISGSIDRMRRVAKSAADGALESAGAGEELARQAETLKGIVGRLLTIVGA
ncbi:MAG: hypothetical protein LAQ30_27455 [Acidobacteriia bacterium]|nr:hypothetical protein [Terriglobia bacterium]